MRFKALLCCGLILFNLCSCAEKQVQNKGPSRIQSQVILDEKKYIYESPYNLEGVLYDSDLTIKSWAEKEIKIEIRKIGSSEDSKQLIEQLNKIQTEISFEKSILKLKNLHIASKNLSLRTQITIYTPSTLKSINLTMENGNLTSVGDLKCNGLIHLRKGALNLARMTGTAEVKVIEGNIKLQSGYLKGDSSFVAEKGNIDITTDLIEGNRYTFEAKEGHVYLRLPAKLSPTFYTVGNVKRNDFTSKNTESLLVSVGCTLGQIEIKKY